MHAITQHHYGSPDALQRTELPEPKPGPRDLLVDVGAASVTQGDLRLRSGDFPGLTFIPGRLALGITGPRAPVAGTAWAGRVRAVGSEVTRFAPGDDVFGIGLGGAYAERLVAREDGAVARSPAGWSHAEAATLPYGAGTARDFLLEKAGLREGERVAIVGAAGGVGRYAVQLARHAGAHVTAIGRPAHTDRLRELGADAVTTLDALDGTFDVLFDTPGALTPSEATRRLTPDGRYVTLLATTGALVAMFTRPLFGGPRVIIGTAMDDAASLDALRELAESGAIRPTLGRRFALAEVAAAHAHVERDRPTADVVIASDA